MLKKELYRELYLLLDELEEINRNIMLLYGSGKSEREIGKTVGITHKAVNKRKHNCFEILRIKLLEIL